MKYLFIALGSALGIADLIIYSTDQTTFTLHALCGGSRVIGCGPINSQYHQTIVILIGIGIFALALILVGIGRKD